VLLVVLRLGLGCHFLYEGVWKIKHADEFTAEPFLTQAKGPLAGMFYAMIPDIDGRQRLQADVKMVKDAAGKEQVADEPLKKAWEAIRDQFVASYRPRGKDQNETQRDAARLKEAAEKVCQQHVAEAEKYLTDAWGDIQVHFGALDRFEKEQAPGHVQDAAFQRQRRWEEMQKLRGEAKVWLTELDTREHVYRRALQALVEPEDAAERRDPKAEFQPARWNPFAWSRIEQINFAVTYGLTAIGLCLVLGLCTRLAALGGAAFMCFVVMTQPAWPGIFPPDPAVAGHALLVNKDFIEMLALLVVASVPAGRWGGLDYFLYHFLLNPFLSKTMGGGKK
jgi:uncharacterized membrane protein YphA (DoxX/SURF4 family)